MSMPDPKECSKRQLKELKRTGCLGRRKSGRCTNRTKPQKPKRRKKR